MASFSVLKIIPSNFAKVAYSLSSPIVLAATHILNKNGNSQRIAALADNNATVVDYSADGASFVISFGPFR